MIGRFLLSFASVVGLVFPHSSSDAKEAEPVTLTPTTKWHLDYAENKCRLVRAFGKDDNRHLIFFEQSGPDRTFGLTVAGPAFEKFSASRETMLQFGLGQNAQETNPFKGTTDAVGAALIYSSASIEGPTDEEQDDSRAIVELAHIDPKRAAAVDYISFSQKNRVVIAQTGNLEAPMKALNVCAQDLVAYWGLDLEKHRTATRFPEWTNRNVVAKRIGDTYPSQALKKGEQGIIRMRVIVDEKGTVANCFLENATTVESLESPACKEMTRAVFEPALDQESKPMRSFFVTQIVYKIE